MESALPVPPAAAGTARDAEEALTAHLDRLEAALGHREAELCRLRTELELRGLYIRELHGLLEAQAQTLTRLERRVRRMEEAAAAPGPPVPISVKNPG